MSRILSLFIMFIAIAGWLPAPVTAQDGTPESSANTSWCVSVWYPSSAHPGGYDTLMAHLDQIDEVNPFWYAANADGNLLVNAGAEDADKLAAWGEAGLLVLPTIANASPLAIADAETRAFHVGQIIDLVERWDYAGIDLDYESFPLETRDPFSDFVETLARELHARGRVLSVTVHAKTDDQGAWESAAAQDWPRLAAAADIFRIMTYDYHNRASREAGPIGPPEWSADVLQYAASVTDLGKVRLGLHFYGYRWQRSEVAPVTWESVQHTIDSFDVAVERDPADMEAFISYKVTGLPRQTIYFADATGLAAKLELLLARFPTLGGVAIWGLGGEDPANWDTLDLYRRGLCAQ